MAFEDIVSGTSTHDVVIKIRDDDSGVDGNTVSGSTLRVNGPGGFSKLATLKSRVPSNGNSSLITATYELAGPFSSALNGTFVVSSVAGRVADVAGNKVSTFQIGQFQCAIAVIAAPVISAIANQSRTADGSAFSLTPVNTGGAADSWSATGLPAGFTINSSTGAITGTLNTASTSNITITATNAGGSDSESFSLAVASPLAAPSISPIGNQSRNADGSTFSLTPTNTGGAASSWSATGLPAGFSINPSTGAIAGTLNTVATNTITITATNAAGSDSESFNLVVAAVSSDVTAPSVLPTTSFGNITANQSAYQFSVTITDPSGVNSSTVSTGAVVVTDGLDFFKSATLISKNPASANANNIVAVYEVAGPFNASLNGTLSARTTLSGISDLVGNSVGNTLIGTFDVAIASAFSLTNQPAVIRVWGQSNTYGTVQNGPYPGPYPTRAKFLEDSSNTIKTIDSSFSQNYGSLIYLARSLEETYPSKDFVFIVTAQGGTGFNSGGGWNPGETQRTAWVAHNQSSAAILSAAYPGGWEEFGVIGVQGENDANGNTALANAYQAKVEALRTEIRSIVEAPALPFYMVRLHIDANYANTNIIRAAHEAVSTAIINVDSCALLVDQIHYTIAGYQCMAAKIENTLDASIPVAKAAIANTTAYDYTTTFDGADTAAGTLDDWVQYWQSNGSAPGYFYRSGNQAVGTAKRYPRIMRPSAIAFVNMWARMEIPAQTWDGEPSFHLYLRYVHPQHSGYHVSVRPGRSTPAARVGVNKSDYAADTFTSQFTNFTDAYVPFSIAWDKTKSYIIQASAITNGSITSIKCQGYEKVTGAVLFNFTHTDNTANLLNAAGVAGLGYFKQSGVSDPVVMKFDNFEMHELKSGAVMPAYVGTGAPAPAPNVSAIANQNRTADGSAFTLTPTNTGGAATSWSATGLPAGFTVNTSTGAIAGTLNTASTNTITITATNATGSDSESFDLVVAAVVVDPSAYTYTTTFDGANTTEGTLDDWVQYWQSGSAPGYFYRLNNQAVGTAKRYPRLLRPSANAFQNMWARVEIPAQTWDGEPSFHLYLRYVHPQHSGYHVSVRPGRSTPAARVGVNKANYSADTFVSQFADFGASYVPFSVAWDKTKSYIIQASAITNGSLTSIKCQGFEKATGTVLFSFTHTDNTASLLSVAGVAGIGYYKQTGVSDAVVMKFDNFEMHELTGSAVMPTYVPQAAPPQAPNISAIANQNRTNDGSTFSLTPTNTGGAATSWSATGLPAGFSINSSTGTITGTLNTVATNTITITATNATGSDSESFDLVVTAVPAGVTVPTPVWDLDFSHDTQGVYNGGFGKFERWNDENNADFWQQTDVNRRPNLSGNTLLNGKFVAIFDGSDVLTPSVLKTCRTMFVLLNTTSGSGRSAGVAPLLDATPTSGDPNNQGYNHVFVRGATETNTAENYNIRMDARSLGGQASVDGGPISATSTQPEGSSIYLGLTPAQSYGTHVWMAQPVIPYEISKIGFFGETNGGSFTDFYLKGNIGQVKFFAERLTQAQIDYVYGEMMWDWGLQSQLPAGHPYKNAAPA